MGPARSQPSPDLIHMGIRGGFIDTVLREATMTPPPPYINKYPHLREERCGVWIGGPLELPPKDINLCPSKDNLSQLDIDPKRVLKGTVGGITTILMLYYNPSALATVLGLWLIRHCVKAMFSPK